jgi:ethanolamine ammonia-lyase small subunit
MTPDADPFLRIRKATPARLDVGRAGPRYTTAAMLAFRADHARAVDAVREEIPADWARRHGMLEVRSTAESRERYLLRPELGRRLRTDDAARVRKMRPKAGKGMATAMVCVGDGLSSAAVQAHAPALVRALLARLRRSFRLIAPPLFIRNARVRIQDHVGEIARPDLIVMIIGERPGLATAESLSAYIIWRPRLKSLEPDRTVISNIHPGGIPIAEAAEKIAEIARAASAHRASGAVLAERRAEKGKVVRTSGGSTRQSIG